MVMMRIHLSRVVKPDLTDNILFMGLPLTERRSSDFRVKPFKRDVE